MKLTIERAALLRSLNHVQSVVERRNTIPILSNVKLVADKGYDSQALREWLDGRGTQAVIPPRKNRKIQYHYDAAIYRQRNVIERMFCRLKDWRRVATRYDRKVSTYLATVTIAAIVMFWL